MNKNSSTRVAVRSVWQNEVPDFSGVADESDASRVLTDLIAAILDILEYRRLSYAPAAIQLVSSDRLSYLRYEAATDRAADVAVHVSHALAAHAEDANALGAIIGTRPQWKSPRILVLANPDGATIKRLDLDPLGGCLVTWHGPFDHVQFAEIATGITLLLTHLVAHVFDDDDGTETFEESFDWVF